MVNGVWCCYAFNYNSRIITIMDPNLHNEDKISLAAKHEGTTAKLSAACSYCMHKLVDKEIINRTGNRWVSRLICSKSAACSP